MSIEEDKYQRLQELVKRLTKTLEDIVENDGHYPENAPIRKLLTEARETTKFR